MKKFIPYIFSFIILVAVLILGTSATFATDGLADSGLVLDFNETDTGENLADSPHEDVVPFVLPEFYIKSVNPGYTVDDVKNVGEMIEIGCSIDFSNALVSLAGLTVGYTNSSGNYSILLEFPENSFVAGETILLRLASSPGSELAAETYTKTLAFKAALDLRRGEEIMDSVCWTGKDGCYKDFKSAAPTTLVRNIATGEFEHLDNYSPVYDENSYRLVDLAADDNSATEPSSTLPTDDSPHQDAAAPNDDSPKDSDSDKGFSNSTSGAKVSSSSGAKANEPYESDRAAKTDKTEPAPSAAVSQCKGLTFSELLSYYESSQSEQFIEFHNSTAEQILLDGCQIKYKNKLYPLEGIVRADGYFVRYLTDFHLTKNPSSSNLLELIDTDGTTLHQLEYYNGQRKGTAYAFIGYDETGAEIWRTTFAPTPGEPNNYQEFKTCEEGKVINEATGNCVKVTTVTEKTCADGQYLNPLTGRCKKLETTTTTEKTCKDGYYLNEDTGRCRKITENTGTDYSLVTETYEETSSFTALYVVIGIVVIGLTYLIYEFRHEIKRLFQRFRR